MKDKYTLLNDVVVNLSQYEIEEVSEFEKKKMMKKFISSKNKIAFWNSKKVSAAIIVIFLAFGIGVHGEKVLAAVTDFKYSINSWLGLDDSKEKYSKDIGKTLNAKDTKLTLNEFFIDNARVILNFDVNKQINYIYDNGEKFAPEVYIDGKKLERSSDYLGEALTSINGKSGESNVFLELEFKDLKLSNKERVKLVFSALAKECGASASDFTYGFDYDGSSYKNASKVIKVDKDIIIGKNKLSIGEVTVTPDRVYISGTSKGFSGWDISKNVDCYYDIVDENNNSLPMKEEIGKGAFFFRAGADKNMTTIKIIPYTFNKINENTKAVTVQGKTKYILEEKIITVKIK